MGAGARPALPEPQPYHERVPHPPLLFGVMCRVIHARLQFPWMPPASSHLPRPRPKLDGRSPELESAGGGGCLGPAGLTVRSRVTHHLLVAAWHCAQDRPPPTALPLVSLVGVGWGCWWGR